MARDREHLPFKDIQTELLISNKKQRHDSKALKDTLRRDFESYYAQFNWKQRALEKLRDVIVQGGRNVMNRMKIMNTMSERTRLSDSWSDA